MREFDGSFPVDEFVVVAQQVFNPSIHVEFAARVDQKIAEVLQDVVSSANGVQVPSHKVFGVIVLQNLLEIGEAFRRVFEVGSCDLDKPNEGLCILPNASISKSNFCHPIGSREATKGRRNCTKSFHFWSTGSCEYLGRMGV